MENDSMNLQDIQLHLYEMLKAFDSYCKEKKLQYYLFGGTLLGAIRHKGFIPWDDDIDLMMPRPDYDRLEQFLQSELICNRYIIKKGNTVPFMKIVDPKTVCQERLIKNKYIDGMYLDIFPIDGLPSNHGHFFKKIKFLRTCLVFGLCDINKMNYHFPKTIMYKLFSFVCSLLGPSFFSKKITKLELRYPYNTSSQVGVSVWGWDEKGVFPKDALNPPCYLQFVDKQFPGPNNYDTLLHQLYGEYMIIPSKEKQQIYHGLCYNK